MTFFFFFHFFPIYTSKDESNLMLSRPSGAQRHGGSGKLEFVLVVNVLVQAV